MRQNYVETKATNLNAAPPQLSGLFTAETLCKEPLWRRKGVRWFADKSKQQIFSNASPSLCFVAAAESARANGIAKDEAKAASGYRLDGGSDSERMDHPAALT